MRRPWRTHDSTQPQTTVSVTHDVSRDASGFRVRDSSTILEDQRVNRGGPIAKQHAAIDVVRRDS